MQWGQGGDIGGHPTLRLLRAYLDAFLPQPTPSGGMCVET